MSRPVSSGPLLVRTEIDSALEKLPTQLGSGMNCPRIGQRERSKRSELLSAWDRYRAGLGKGKEKEKRERRDN